VKVSYHPRWKAEGADGPYLVSPALMMIVPRQTTVRLTYARTMADDLGLLLTGVALVAGTAAQARRGRLRAQPRPVPENVPPIPLDDCADMPAPTRRWGARVIDVDILLFGSERLLEPDLQIPHPRIAERPFVLAGLKELGVRPPIRPGERL